MRGGVQQIDDQGALGVRHSHDARAPAAPSGRISLRLHLAGRPELVSHVEVGWPRPGHHGQAPGGEVARQYSGALGKVGNCQLGVSINAASEQASCPLDWRLFIPEEGGEGSEFNQPRREKAKLGQDAHHVEKWRLALGMIDELIGWGIEPPVILGDGAYGDITEFRCELEKRELQYVLDVKSATSAYSEEVQPERPEWKGAGRPPKPRYREAPSSLKELAFAAGKQAAQTVTWREGTRGSMTSRFLALKVRPANIHLRNKI